MRAWLERLSHARRVAARASATAAALPPLYFCRRLLGFGVLVAVLHRQGDRARGRVRARHRVRLRLLPGRALLGRDRLLRRCRALRRSTPCRPCWAWRCSWRSRSASPPALVALRRWRAVDGAGAGLRRRLDPRRAVARRPRPAVSLEPGRLGLGGERRHAAGRGLHRHLWAEPAHRGRGRPDRAPVPDRCRACGARRSPCPCCSACVVLAAGRAAPGPGAGRSGHRRRSCASSRPTSPSTTNGTPRSG